VQNIGLLIADEIQQVGGEVGPTYEVVISRTRYVSFETKVLAHIVACGVSLANAEDLGEWIGVKSHTTFNFLPNTRPLNVEIHIQSFTIPHFPSLVIAMSKPAYLAILEYLPTKLVLVFVSSHRECHLTVNDLVLHCAADDGSNRLLNLEPEELQKHLDHVNDKGLVETLKHGIGYYHEALDR